MLFPVFEDFLATETGDGVCILVTMIESSRCHICRGGLDADWPGVERRKPLIPILHVGIVTPAALWSCFSMFSGRI